MQKKFGVLGKRHLGNNFIIYFMLLVTFILGIVFGSILINKLKAEQINNILRYFSWILDYIVDGEQLSVDILKSSLISNMQFTLIIWITGFAFIGTIIIPIVIGLKGISIGFIVGFLVKEFGVKGFIFAVLGLLPHYLIILPAIITIGALGLSRSMSFTGTKGKKTYRVNTSDGIDYSISILLLFIIIILGCFIESFITPYFLKLAKLSL